MVVGSSPAGGTFIISVNDIKLGVIVGASPERRRKALIEHLTNDHKLGPRVFQEAVVKDRLRVWHRDTFPSCKWTINQGIREQKEKHGQANVER